MIWLAMVKAEDPEQSKKSLMRLLAPVEASLTFIGECVLLLLDALFRLVRRPFEMKEIVGQMAFIGAASIPIVALTTFSSGAVIALYSAEILLRYGAGSLAGGTVGLAVTREIAPVLAGIMVAARCGSAMAAQIGTMNVTEQIDALRSLNVHPTNYLVIPRLIACLVVLPVLALVGAYAGVTGGYLVAVVVSGVPDGSFWNSIRQFVVPFDLFAGMVKTIVFGLIIAVVACQQGLRTKGGAVGVGKATTNTVVLTMVLIYIANYFLTAALFTGNR
ncbi:MAG: ABC transporter permease [Fimbriimonadaceae bacterium]|jgi:phospholipid/cholesterol/gamma-HCH transport system permease protein|nr:ABC transporter permease [Fimbriimonadaceae bacterium]